MFTGKQMINSLNSLNSLNNVAVDYFSMGLRELSYQIWDELYQEICGNEGKKEGLLAAVSCNMGNALRQNGSYEEAYQVCRQGLQSCFEKGATSALPELVLQLSVLCMKMGEREKAKWLYIFGRHILCWTKHGSCEQTMEEMMKRDFLVYR